MNKYIVTTMLLTISTLLMCGCNKNTSDYTVKNNEKDAVKQVQTDITQFTFTEFKEKYIPLYEEEFGVYKEDATTDTDDPTETLSHYIGKKIICEKCGSNNNNIMVTYKKDSGSLTNIYMSMTNDKLCTDCIISYIEKNIPITIAYASEGKDGKERSEKAVETFRDSFTYDETGNIESGIAVGDFDNNSKLTLIATKSSILCHLSFEQENSDFEENDNLVDDENLLADKTTNKNYSSGQYKVGVDIPAGEYVLFSSENGYFCISSDANGSDIIGNDNFNNNSIITVFDGQYVELSRCYAVPFNEAPNFAEGKEELNDGMYKVGYHIPAGEYKLICTGKESGYYCLYPDSVRKKIISNDNFEGSRYVSISEGQYLILRRCKLILQ